MSKIQQTASNSFTLIGDLFAITGALLKSRRDRGVEQLHEMSEATRDYASTFTDMPNLRAKMGAASENMEVAADYAVHTDIEHMVADATVFARKHPVATLSAALAVGVFAAMMLRPPAAEPEVKPVKVTVKKKVIASAPISKGKKKTNGAVHAA